MDGRDGEDGEDGEVPFCFLLYKISAAADAGNLCDDGSGSVSSSSSSSTAPHDDSSAGTEP